MSTASELWWQGRTDEIWKQCCGFIDLSLEDFMNIQRRLLLEQIQLLNGCELGRKVMRGARPRSVEEFRALVPLTNYGDYIPYLDEKREDVLPEPPIYWQRTSGKSGAYYHKWAPLTQRTADELSSLILAASCFCTCKEKGHFPMSRDEKLLYIMAPPPYVTGTYIEWAKREFDFNVMPSEDEAVEMTFEERIKQGFQQAIEEGMSMLFGISGVIVAVGERLSKREDSVKIMYLISKPRVLIRLAKGLLKAKLARRPLMPKDLWSLKGIMSGGTDTSVYKEKIKEMWGRYPLDVYGSAEASLVALQTWDYEGMTFVPQLNFIELIPEEERLKEKENPTYQPGTILLDEVKAGEVYEIVITNFHGGAFTRYRLNDLVKITSLRNDKLDIDIPQMAFYSRSHEVINFEGFYHTSLTEKVIWQAVNKSRIPYEDWLARKEPKDGKPALHLYVEPRDGELTCEQVASAVHEELKKLDSGYADLEVFFGLQPLEVTFLPQGAFREYMLRQQEAGADLGHLKPPHINPPDEVINSLTTVAAKPKLRRAPVRRVAARPR